MSAPAAEVFDRSPYEAPQAELLDNSVLAPDRLFSAEGRVGVLRYNARLAQALLVMMAGGLLVFGAIVSDSTVLMVIAGVPAFLVVVGGTALMVYTSIKRLHDLGHSGWFYLIGIIPIVGTLWMLYYSLKPGSNDDNNYGPRREATSTDKILGYLGIFFTVLLSIVAFIPMD